MGSVTRIRPADALNRLRQSSATAGDYELSDVLAEISQLMSAEGAVLSVHSEYDGAPELLGTYISSEIHNGISSFLSDPQLSGFVRDGAVNLGWASCTIGEKYFDILMLPVSRVEGHDRLVVSVLFRRPSRNVREGAEHLFESRRPMAMGYFRLWQLERARARRIAALEAASDVTDIGILLFTRRGDLDFVNSAANDLLTVGDGLRRYRKSVQASDITDSVKFQVSLNHAIAANDAVDGAKSARRRAPLIRLNRPSGKPLIAIVVASEQRAVGQGDIAVMVYLFDPVVDLNQSLKPVCAAFRLSPVETQLTCHLAAGRSIAAAASALKIKIQTARGYLKHIFVKTDTRRQSELVHLMLSNIFRVGRTILPEIL